MNISFENQEKARELLSQMTLDEKIGMIHGAGLFRTAGVERLGIPPLRMSDGPMGVRKEFFDDSWNTARDNDDYVTYLPSNSAIAATWNRECAYESGRVLGEEARGRGKDVILAPGINIKRSPLNGRNFEYMSEDPYLTAEQCVPLIQGIQENDVAACVKHFAVNSQETNRLWVDEQVSEQALQEICFPAFHAAVEKGGCLSVMGAYNLVNGVRCCENKYLLDEVLRSDWNYDGVVISDWGGVLNTIESAKTSMDMEMSIYTNFDEYRFAAPLKKAVEDGKVDEKWIDQKVYRVLCLILQLHMMDGKRKSGCYNTPEHRSAALCTARESIVLLKNEDRLLPLSPSAVKKILVVGDNADRVHSNGGGSAEIKALYEVSPLLGLRSLLGGNSEITFVKGYYVPDKSDQTENWQETSLSGGADQRTLPVTEKEAALREKYRVEAAELAAQYDTVIFFGGLNHDYDLEDQDRPDMKLPYGQEEVIDALLTANPNTVIVLCAGSPVDMSAFADRAKAIVWNWYNGMEGGTALAEVLLGKVNPSGRLPETFPKRLEDCSAHSVGTFGKRECAEHTEGIFVGYRHYEKQGIPVQFCFGHGLSYTAFEYSNFLVTETSASGNGNLSYKVSLDVTNIGDHAGKEVVQLYIGPKDEMEDRPVKELKAYEKILLEPMETKRVIFHLDETAFQIYDETEKKFEIRPGCYAVSVGASLEDIRMRGEIKVYEKGR